MGWAGLGWKGGNNWSSLRISGGFAFLTAFRLASIMQ
jgi:hypothetical protein